MRMLPSNGFAYNFNGPALNGYGQLAINHPTGHSPLDLMETGQAEHATHLMDGNGQHSQLYELHPHQPQATAVGQNGYGQPANLDSNLEISGLSLFKLKSFLQPAKKPMNGSVSMQSMFPGGQETTSPQLLSSPTENGIHLINHESNLSHHSPIVQTTSASYYNNLAPSAIGTSAIVSAPMLLSQSTDHQATIDSIRNQSIGSNQLIGFEPHHLARSSQPQSTAHHHHHPHHQLPSGVHQSRTAGTRLTRDVPSRNFICKFCKVSFQSKGEMQIHYSAHTREEKPFKCEVCAKRFKRANYLKQHKRVHTNETPFSCKFEKCDKKFKQLGHLKQHIRTHTGEKPYKCKYSDCDKCFSQESNLRSHMRSHESGRPFKCNSCHLTFELDSDLLAHIPKHRETKHTKIHICNFCGKSYDKEQYLTKHVQAKHAERIQSLRASGAALPGTGVASVTPAAQTPSTRSRTKQLSKLAEPAQPPTSPSSSSNSSSSKSNLVQKSKKSLSSPSLAGSLAGGCLPAVQSAAPQATSTPSHINSQYSNSWNRSTGGSSSPDSVNSSNCMSSTASTEMISLTNCLSNSTLVQQDQMFTDLSGNSIPTGRYEQSPMDLFYNHHPNNMTPNGQHQSAFTALGRSSSHSPKYFTNTCESGFVFSKPQYSPISQPLNGGGGQLHSAVPPTNHQQHSLSPGSQQQQSILSHNGAGQLGGGGHNSSLQDNGNQLQQQHSPVGNQQAQLQMHQLSPLNGHMQSSLSNNQSSIQNSIQSSIGSNQTSPVQPHHLQHGQTSNQPTASQHHSQLIALNQIRNYAYMPNGSPTSILPPQPAANHHHHSSQFVNNLFLNAQNNSSIQSMSGCNLNDYPIMILQ